MDPAAELPPLGHVGYVVEDVDASVESLRRMLGAPAFRTYDYVPVNAWVQGRPLRPLRLRIAMGTLTGDTRIELIQPVEGDTPHARFLREKGPGLHHLAFYSDRYEEWRQSFKARGAEIVFEAEAEDDVVGYRRSLYVQVTGMASIVEISEIARKRK
ncbi:MAG TPA: VOC family protein [Spirochaetia bacterium]|nr:VOC family protein [Spirochaetia bacterium]